MADGLLLPAVVMLVGAAGLFWVWLKERAQVAEEAELVAAGYGRGDIPMVHPERSAHITRPPPINLAVIAVALVGVVATTVQVARIGHSGAEAAWPDVGQASPPPAVG